VKVGFRRCVVSRLTVPLRPRLQCRKQCYWQLPVASLH
jgi:hypothetical protein